MAARTPASRSPIPCLALGWVAASAALALISPARAEVASSGEGGFTVTSSVTVEANPSGAYFRFLQIGSWWDPKHTYSGEGANLTLKAQPNGCFCEALPHGGFVEHMRVIYAVPDTALRMRGGLGPLQEMGVTGTMSVKFEAAGEETRVTLTYVVSGYAPGKGLGELAAPVDGVLTEQLQRFKQWTDKPGQ